MIKERKGRTEEGDVITPRIGHKVEVLSSYLFSLPKFCIREYKERTTSEAGVGGRLEFR
jgi:hypothetical protein